MISGKDIGYGTIIYMKKFFLLFYLLMIPLTADSSSISPQEVITECDRTASTLIRRKNELSSKYSRLMQSTQRLQFQGNTYPSDSNQQREKLERIAREYNDTLETLIMLKELELQAYNEWMEEPALTPAKKKELNRAALGVQSEKKSFINEQKKLKADGFVSIRPYFFGYKLFSKREG